MDTKQLEENILLKIRNGDSNFTKEELVVIEKKDYIIKELFIAIGKGIFPCSYELSDIIFGRVFNFMDIETIPNDIVSNACYEYLKALMDNGYYEDHIIEFFNTLNVNEENINKMKKLIEEKLNDKSVIFTRLAFNPDTINTILDYKRYDDIKNLKFDYNISNYITKELYERIKKEWPYDRLPEVIIKYERENDIYNYSAKDDLDDLFFSYGKYAQSKEKIFLAILEKMKSLDNLNILTSSYNLVSVLHEYASVGMSKRDEVAKILFDRYCLRYADYLLQKKIITREEFDEKLKYCIEHHLELPEDILEKYISEDDEIYLKQLLDFGKLDSILEIQKRKYLYKNDATDLIKENEQYIVDQINNDNPYYKNHVENPHIDLKNYPLITRAILEKGQLKILDTKYIDLSLISIDELISLIEKNPTMHVLIKADSIEFKEKLVYKLLSDKKYDLIFSKDLLSASYVDSNVDLILQHLDNIYFANMIVEYGFSNVKNNEKVVYKLLQNNLFTENVVELINHDEELISYYSDDTYNLVKDYYIKKYDLNIEHLDSIEKKFGPLIIRYLSNDSIKNIINLDEETFNKVVNLFPMQEYTLKDLEAGFESLIQYLYGKSNIEDITIFPNFIHAMDDNNIDEINRIKEKLILYTKPDLIKTLSEKYGLNNVTNTDDLLNIIIQKYNTDEREHYLDILHEITNEYILTSRENFRNNHYFEAKFKNYSHFLEKVIKAIDTNDADKYVVLIASIAAALDEYFYKQFSMKDQIPEEADNKLKLMYYLANKIRNKEERNKYLPVLKETVDYYYKKERNKHLKEISLGEELSLPYTWDEKSMINESIRYIIENASSYYDKEMNPIIENIASILYDHGIDRSLVIDCLDYYSGNKMECKNDQALIQKTMPIVIRTATSYISKSEIYYRSGEEVDMRDILKVLDKQLKIKKIYNLNNTTDPYPILLNLNVDLLKTGLFKDEELYSQLVNIMSKKKLHLLPDNLKELLDECGISSDYSDIASFINFFGPILDNEKKKLEAVGKDPEQALSGLASIMINADTYSSISSVYSQILGEKDAKLIKSNPKPNSAVRKIENNQRLVEAVKITINNYLRQEVTVPAFDTDVSFINDIDEEKKLNVIVGNFTDPSNLTHGERTGACMRIGGAGESLFNFCLDNPNGFHIRFEDPETHEYISRVSGFRNGNTVFLNELRYSCDKSKYSDLDVVKACKEAAKLLVEYSKDSECPIDNVVIARQYAMTEIKEKEIPLYISDNKEGLPGFYSDIGNTAIVLATTATDKPFTPINFDKSKIPMYKTCRSKPMILTSEKELMGKINRVASIKTVLSGVNYEDVGRMEFEDGLLCGVVSDDWYIYVDKNKNINYDFIDIDERAKVELQQYLEVIDNIIKQTEKEKEEMESDVYEL